MCTFCVRDVFRRDPSPCNDSLESPIVNGEESSSFEGNLDMSHAKASASVQRQEAVGVGQGKVVAERYAEELGIEPSTRLNSFSMAKSITSALLGMRVGDGAIRLTDLAQAPSWSPQEVALRNITGAALLLLSGTTYYSTLRHMGSV